MNVTLGFLPFTDCVLPGAGAFEIAAYQELMKYKDSVKGRARLGKLFLVNIHIKRFIKYKKFLKKNRKI